MAAAEIAAEEMAAGEMPTREMPARVMPAREMPAREMPARVMPAVEISAVPMPAVAMPSGVMPTGETVTMEMALMETVQLVEKTNNLSLGTLQIEEHIENVIVEENSTAIFQCKVNDHLQPTCTWYKDGKRIIQSQRTNITCDKEWHQLEIKKVRPEDHGIYTIICQNEVSQKKRSTANLYVMHPNKSHGVFYTRAYSKTVNTRERIIQASKGELIELEVSFQHEVIEQNYIWIENNEVVKENERTIIINTNKTTLLCLLRCELTDSGIYYVVAITKNGLSSSYYEVQVTEVDDIADDELPFIEEFLPEEIQCNENEVLRLNCRASFDKNTIIQWTKDGLLLDKNEFAYEDFGDRYLGLRIENVLKAHSGKYTINLHDYVFCRSDSSSCIVTVIPAAPIIVRDVVQLIKPLHSAVACCGSKVVFDCSFSPVDPSYFVVWHVGPFKVKRSNNQFSVVCKNGEFLLFIKKLEPVMSGEVVCELWKSVPNQAAIRASSSTAGLTVIPPCILLSQRAQSAWLPGKLYNDTNPCDNVCVLDYYDVRTAETCIYNPYKQNVMAEIILDITFCKLEENGSFFLRASKGRNPIAARSVSALCMTNTLVIQWDDSEIPSSWYQIQVRQSDGRFADAGLSTVPSFDVQQPPLERLMHFRVRLEPQMSNVTFCSVSIEPTPEEVLRPAKRHFLWPMDRFELSYARTKDMIGSGAFGSVILVRNLTGEYFAAKVLKAKTQKKRETAMREFELMKQLHHPKLVQLMDAYISKDTCMLVMDYMWGGELFDRMVEEEHLREVDVVSYVKQILEGLHYLHSKHIVHMDLKPENIVCVSPNSGLVKIIDFGVAKVLGQYSTRAIYGTREYMAPEVLNFNLLTVACDLWSLGVLTYLLLSGVTPFAGKSWLEISAKIVTGKFDYDDNAFREISDLAKEFINRLLVVKVANRMSASAALEHKWIREGPPKGAKGSYMLLARNNLKSYLASYRAKWQRAGNVIVAAHRLLTHAGISRAAINNEQAIVPLT